MLTGPPPKFHGTWDILPKLRYTVFAGYDELPVHAPLELAQHLVFGAVKFAREFGFEPHPDFAAAADHLGAWSGRCPIQFGYKGSPFYIQGPHDDVESIARTLAGTPAGQALGLKLNAALVKG